MHTWVGKQDGSKIPIWTTLVDNIPGKPRGLLHVKDAQGGLRVIVPAEQRERLVKQEHQVLLHVGGRRVLYALQRRYYWPNMKDTVIKICASCPDCQAAQVRRQNLQREFAQADDDSLPLPRQQYGIDFYGHAKGEILVAIDLCTREVLLWFLKDRKQDTVARALLGGLIFQKGVPLVFRNDEASEFVGGVVAAMNTYLGIEQITTGGYNPRANAVAERFMSTLGHMLRVCSDAEYKSITQYLQCIAFAHNCTFNSQIEATPFEIGHGLPARTVTEARMSIPKLSLHSEEGIPVQLHDKWEKGIHLKILELSTRLTKVAQAHSQWHRRMTAEKLNQAGRTIDEDKLKPGDDVYFYRPPSQGEVMERDRKKKHLYHYHGPAKVVKKLRNRQYEISYTSTTAKGNPKTTTFKRDASMLVPAKQYMVIPEGYDPTETAEAPKPRKYDGTDQLDEGELIICRGTPQDTEWYVAEVRKVLPRQITLHYLSTYTPPVSNYGDQDSSAIAARLRQVRFRRTWYIRSGIHRGKATVKPPYPNNPDLRVWEGPLFDHELPQCVFVRNVGMSPEGQLDDDTVNLAQELPIPHAVTPAVEDEETAPVEKGTTPPLFMFSQQPMCECPECTRLLLRKRPRDGEPKGLGRVVNLTPAKRARSGNGSSEEQQQPEEDGGTSSPANSTPKVIIE